MSLIQKALDTCTSYVNATIDFVKDPVKSTEHAFHTFKKMDVKELTVAALKVAAAALIGGLIGLGAGASFGIIAPVLSFVAVPLSVVGSVFGAFTMLAFLSRQKEKTVLVDTNGCLMPGQKV